MARRIECGINLDPMNPAARPTPQALCDLGATWVRFTFKDASDAPQPSAFGDYDVYVQALKQAGISILMILTYETFPGKPACDADDATWNAYIVKFAARCRLFAQYHGSQVAAYQIWNEPDLLQPSPGYDPCVRKEVFGRMLKEAHNATKMVSASKVITAGLASGQPSYLQQVTASTGGVLYVDAVGVHPCGRRPTPNWPPRDAAGNPWGFGVLGDLIRDYHAVASKAIWVSEVGTDSSDAPVQAQFPKRTYEVLNKMAEKAPYVFWYCWSDGMGVPFGLTDTSGAKKPNYDSCRAFALQPFEGQAASTVSDELKAALLAGGEAAQAIQFNPQAALQKRVFADGLMPNSAEFPIESSGVQYVAQRAEHLGTGQVRVYYARAGDWDNVKSAPLPLKRTRVTDDPSLYFGDREGHAVRYIIVHSSASPVGVPALNTLGYLRGPNDREVSCHELVLPGDLVHRMVPDELGAPCQRADGALS